MRSLSDHDAAHTKGLSKPRLERAIGVIYRLDSEPASHYFEGVLPGHLTSAFGSMKPEPFLRLKRVNLGGFQKAIRSGSKHRSMPK